MMQQGQLNIGWSSPSNLSGYIYNGDIYSYTNELIGVTTDKYEKVTMALQKCKDKLIELGAIQIPKTQEQINAEQAALIEKQNKVIDQLLEKLNGTATDITIPTEKCTKQGSTISTESFSDNGSENDSKSGGYDKSISKSKKSRTSSEHS